MANVTLRVDDEVIRKVRKIAIDKHTTMTAMIRGFLESVARRETAERQRALQQLEASFRKYSRPMGPRTWTREDLHER